MKEQQATITIQPEGLELQGFAGDNLYTLLLVAGVVTAEERRGEWLRLEKGGLSPASEPEVEEAVFSRAELAEGWLLASQHQITGDAEFTLWRTAEEENVPIPNIQDRHGYGLAFKVGLATIAGGLVNLENMLIPLMTTGFNSHCYHTPDPQLRLRQALQDRDKAEEFISLLRRDVHDIAQKLARRSGVPLSAISRVSVCGQYAMTCMLRNRLPGEDDHFGRVYRCPADEAGLSGLAGDAEVIFLPPANQNIGSDAIMGALASGMMQKKEQTTISVLANLGMSGEIMAVGQGRMVACCVPSLPFEGVGVSCGMPPVTGAISDVHIDQRVTLETVRQGHPRGLSGAGLLAAVSALRQQGLIDNEGRLGPVPDGPEKVMERLRGTAAGREFILSPKDSVQERDIVLTQEDVLQLQMAKAAVYAAIEAAVAALGGGDKNISEILLAEPFRANIRPEAALSLGMLPPIPAEKVTNVGGVGWQGSYLALSGDSTWQDAERLAKAIEYLDLNSDRTYANLFLPAMDF